MNGRTGPGLRSQRESKRRQLGRGGTEQDQADLEGTEPGMGVAVDEAALGARDCQAEFGIRGQSWVLGGEEGWSLGREGAGGCESVI